MAKGDEAATSVHVPWFIADKPISGANEDAFSHVTVAAALTAAVAGAANGTIIGLMGTFGAGKTSVVNMAGDDLRRVHALDVVHVSADKHSGEARSRNIVHSVAGAMVDSGLVGDVDVRAILRRLRGTDSLAVPEPEQMRLSRILRDRKGRSLQDIWATLTVTFVLFVILLGAAVVVGHRPATLLNALGAAVVALGAMKVGYDHIVDSLFEIPKRTESTPRAEAADDVEIVFEQLVTKHFERKKRPLVVCIDDIDRLGEADLLDAMRSIKSLQAVPRNHEPRFVVSCDEGVLLKALSDAAKTSSGARALDTEAGIASEPNNPPEEAARDYLDKFFHLRIEMPPNVTDDMPNLARRLLKANHPVRQHLTEEQIDRILLVLARGEVRSPRRLIHRMNRFLASFKIALDRESVGSAGRLHPGDVSGRPVTLARLAVIEVEFPWFHAALMRDEGLLAAADRFARHEDTSPTDDELLAKHEIAINVGWESLRRYLISTWRSSEKSGSSIVPLLYLAEPESGRTLGNERLASLLGAVRAGDTPLVESGLADLAPEHLPLAAAEISSMLNLLTRAETRDALSGAVAALAHLGEYATGVALASADLVHDLGPDALQPEEFKELLSHLPPDNRAATLRTFARVPEGEKDDANDRRMVVAAQYLVVDPTAIALPESVAMHLDRIHETMGWDAAPAWIATGASLDRTVHADLVDSHLVPAMYRLSIGDGSFAFDDTAKTLIQLVRAMSEASRQSLADMIRSFGSLTNDSAQLLAATFDAGYPITHVNDALRLSDAVRKELGDLEPSAVRDLAASATLCVNLT